jgi:8-oxo-dGTP pyrophosphatase MutT (NUDIX family)
VTSATRPRSGSVDNRHPGRTQFRDGPFAVTRLDLDRTGRVEVDDDVEARALGVERRRLDAVIERETADVHRVDVMRAQQLLEVGVLEPGIALGIPGPARIDDVGDPIAIERVVQRGARRVPDAVHRPGPALLGERRMVRRVPVTRGDDVARLAGEPVDGLDHRIAVGNRERTAGAEVILDVDDDQAFHTPEYSQKMAIRLSTLREELGRVLLSPEQAIALDVSGHKDAAVLVPLYVEHDELHAVFTRRREDLRRHPGEISFPGGRFDEGEADLRATALREADEEIGLAPEAVDIVGALQPTPTIATGYAVYPFVGLIEPGGQWTPSESEVAEVLEFSLRELLHGYGRRRLIRRGLPIRTDTYVVGDNLIWGATARILADLFDRIEPLVELRPDAG